MERKRQDAILELITTEEAYIDDMITVHNVSNVMQVSKVVICTCVALSVDILKQVRKCTHGTAIMAHLFLNKS
jgi:hypothetical protein